MQLVTYIGWLLHRTRGGIIAGMLFVMPGFLAILGLSIAYTTWHGVAAVDGLLFGLKAAVLAIVAEAVIRIGKRVLRNTVMCTVAVSAFLGIFVFQVPFPAIIGAAAVIGFIGGRTFPAQFAVLNIVGGNPSNPPIYTTDNMTGDHTRPSVARTLGVLAVWLPLWLVPVCAIRLALGSESVFTQQAEFFSQAAAITFGGAYAVLAYVAQQAVDIYGWVTPDEMLTGLGMAESTPGPLIMVLQFVGYMGAYRDASDTAAISTLHPILAGTAASVLVAWVTFVPCFLWIFLGAPYVEHMRGRAAFTAALSCITAAVVGVILNLGVWLSIHTLFQTVSEHTANGALLLVPDFHTLDVAALLISTLSAFAIFRLRWGALKTLALAAGLGALWFTLRPIVVSIMSVAFLTVGCTTPPESAHESDTISRSVPTQDVQPGSPSLVIDVAPTSEIRGVVRSVFQDSRGTLWIGGECDLFRNDGSTLTSYKIVDDVGQGVTITKIVEDKAGNIWCGTSGGVTRIDGKSFKSYGKKDGLISCDVWSMAVDGSGVIWIGTIEGVCRFDGKTFSPFALPEAQPDPTRGVTSGKFVHCITVDRKGRVWFGTNGGAYVYDGKTLTNLSERDGLPNNAVGSILEDKSGNIWFGTIHGGISRFDGRDFTNFTEQGVVEGKEIWCIHEGRSGNVWISGKRSPMYRYDGNTFTKVNEQDGITSLAFTILEDNSGRLWLSGTNGLFRHDGESFVRVTKDGPWR